mmetsp:Transcript_13929/g.23984  ORF Transcript_13929/g.23984 Transcript_13929/m.23984 type:complete len:100 (-) Transcript_13929:58-357(-)
MDRAEEHLTEDKMKMIAKRLFLAGFCFLPFIWLVNAFYFRRYYKHEATPDSVRTYVKASLICFTVFMIVWLIWIITFYAGWNSWGAVGESLTVIIPDGQ